MDSFQAISPAGRKDASSSSSDMTNRSPTISSGSSTGGAGRVPPWRLANQMKPRSNSSLEALETQQRMFERLQDEVEQELANKDHAVYGERANLSCTFKWVNDLRGLLGERRCGAVGKTLVQTRLKRGLRPYCHRDCGATLSG
jgi:hypothetical protein